MVLKTMQAFSKKVLHLLSYICLLIGLICAAPVFAVTQEEAASIVRADTHGRILDAKFVRENNQEVYLIKVITNDSRVIIIRVDAASGRILR